MAAKKSAVQKFKRHADRYGTDQIMDAAIECGLSLDELVSLQNHLDALRPKYSPKPRISAEDRVKRLLGLDEQEEASTPTASK